MDPSTLRPVTVRGIEDESPAPSFRSVVRKSTLLNVVIVLTSFPVLVFAGGPNALAPAVAIMVGVSLLIWTATFTLFSFVSLAWTFWTPVSSRTGRKRLHPSKEVGVADRWLDGPV